MAEKPPKCAILRQEKELLYLVLVWPRGSQNLSSLFLSLTFCSVWLLFCLLTPLCTSTVSVLAACVLSVSPPICAYEPVLNKRLFSVFNQTSQKTWYGKGRRDFFFKQKLLMGFYKRCYFLTTTDPELCAKPHTDAINLYPPVVPNIYGVFVV